MGAALRHGPRSVSTHSRHQAANGRARKDAVALYRQRPRGSVLGSRNLRFLRKPRVAVLTDTPTYPTEYGAIWDYFENHARIPFTPIRAEALRSVDLSNYNVLILPPDRGDGSGYARTLDKGITAKLQEWVSGGGTLIAIKGGAGGATKKQPGLTSVTERQVHAEADQR